MMKKLLLAAAALLFATAAAALDASSIPTKFPIPWANSASSPFIRSIPTASQIGIQGGAASLTDGFPPLTFTPSGAGGVPPFGADFNGILNQVSAWSRWYSAGGPIAYDATFQSSVGGYPSGAVVASITFPGVYWRSTANNNTSNPDTGGANWTAVFGSISPWAGTGGGTANAQTATMAGVQSFSSLVGVVIQYLPGATNSGPTTLSISGLAARNVLKGGINPATGVSGLQPLGGQELQADRPAALLWDGTQYVLLNPIPPSHVDFYVGGAGAADLGNCTNPATPCNTIKYAVYQALQACSGGLEQTVHLATGTWNESVAIAGNGLCTSGRNNPLIISGNGAANTTWNGGTGDCGTLIVNYGGAVYIQNMRMEAGGNACQSTLYAQNGGHIDVGQGIVFGSAFSHHINAEGPGSQIGLGGSNYTIAGSAGAHIAVTSGSLVGFAPVGTTITITGSPTFGTFVINQINGIVYFGAPVSFIGTIGGGAAYQVTTNATIFTDGQGCAFIPGTGGSSSTNGLCL